MSGKHTPGPWFTWNNGVYSGTPTDMNKSYVAGYDGQICAITDDDAFKSATRKANARLIAAAPDLLASLEALVEVCAPNTYPQPDKPESSWAKLQTARAAIAKARGAA